MRARTAATLLLPLLLATAPSCGLLGPDRPVRLEHPDGASVAFRPDFGLIFVPVTIQGRPSEMLLDTGANVTILDTQVAEELGLEVRDRKEARQPGGTVEFGRVRDVAFDLGSGVTVTAERLVTAPMSDFAPILGRRVAGLLGHDLIEQCVLEIDYGAARLVFHDRSHEHAGGGDVLPLVIEDGEPGVRIEVELADGRRVEALPALDTGCTDFLSFVASFGESHPALTRDRTMLQFRGFGFAGETDNQGVAVPALRIGPHEYRHLPVGYMQEPLFRDWSYDGLLGAAFLRRFTVILDYGRSRLILEPGPEADAPYLFDLAGLTLVAGGEHFDEILVHQALLGGAAVQAGIRTGDRLVEVDGRPAEEIGLAALWEMFRADEGSEHALVVERDGERIEASLTLARHPLISASQRDDA